MDDLTFFLLFFVLGTLALYLAKNRRVMDVSSFAPLFFMIKSRYFIPLIDCIAGLAPSLWKFLADLSVVVSFGGLGAAYLSGYRRDNRNLDLILLILGLGVILVWTHEWLIAFAGLIILSGCILLLSRIRNPFADFVFVFTLMGMFFYVFLSISQAYIAAPLGIQQRMLISTLQGAFGLPPLLLGLFLVNAGSIISNTTTTPGVSPAVPTVNSEGELGVTFPGYDIFIPIFYAAISISILLITHEFAHGVLARAHDIKLKSTGLLTFGIIPIGAFVEPDDDDLTKRPSIEKMRVFTAGSFANLMVCLVCAITLYYLYVNALLIVDGVTVYRVEDNSSVKGIISNGTVIYSINGQSTRGINALAAVLASIPAGSNVTILTSAGEVTAKTLASNSGGSRLGVALINHPGGFLYECLGYIIFFNLNIALVNILPIAPFDGWRMLKEVMNAFRISEITAARIVNGILAFSLFLLLLNALPLFRIALNILTGLF